jgi:Aspartyl protease/Domain of unknown function (DUF4124)
MIHRAIVMLAALALGAVAPPCPAHAQLYRWVNEQGEVHFTQGLENIPERFRAGARLLGYPEAAPPGPAPAPGAPPATGEEARPGAPVVRGGARIPFTPGSPILVTVRINGLRTVRLVLDTGAEHTLIHTRTLAAIGVDPTGGRPITVMGVTGAADGRYVGLESLEVGEASVAPLGVIAYDLLLREGDGLLGRDFLDRFKVSVDIEARVVILSPR